jgi:hypothetical protein
MRTVIEKDQLTMNIPRRVVPFFCLGGVAPLLQRLPPLLSTCIPASASLHLVAISILECASRIFVLPREARQRRADLLLARGLHVRNATSVNASSP